MFYKNSKLRKKRKEKVKSKLGFTLIELLIVIAIIGLLSSVVLASLNSARKKARDAKRYADFRTIKTALEMYYDKKSAYPSRSMNSTDANFLKELVDEGILPQAPRDPLNTDSPRQRYEYVYPYTSCDSKQYILLQTLMEQGNQPVDEGFGCSWPNMWLEVLIPLY